MIIQTGVRTDIPAFYSRWFLNRLKEGYVLVRNPYDPQSVTRYRLDPEVVDLIAFCSKNPAPMLEHMDALKDYGQYWFVTITPYGWDIEPNVPKLHGLHLLYAPNPLVSSNIPSKKDVKESRFFDTLLSVYFFLHR